MLEFFKRNKIVEKFEVRIENENFDSKISKNVLS